MASSSTTYKTSSALPAIKALPATTTIEPASAPSPSTTTAQQAARGQRLRQGVSSLAIVAVFAGLAFWGHRTGWTFIGDDSSANAVGENELWCAEHNVSEATCIECQPDLKPAEPDFGWCQPHGVAQCPLHHPEVAQLKEPPTIEPSDFEQAARALALVPRGENNSRCLLHQRRIQFASPEAIEKAGVDIAVVQQQPIVEAVTANGEIIYDPTRFAHLSSRAAGTVWRVFKQVGDKVREGDLLVLVDAAEVGRAKSQLLEALTELRLQNTILERLRPLAANGTVPGRKFTEAQAAMQAADVKVRTAQQALVNLGLPVDAKQFDGMELDEIADRIQQLGLPEEIRGAGTTEITSSNLLPIRAPLDGVVVERHVVPGEVIATDTRLMSVADTRRMWLMLNVRQEDVGHVERGQTVRFRATGEAHRAEVEGAVDWINTAVDEGTRTVQVRAELANDDGQLRANTFGTGQIVLREEPQATVVPSDAVHWDGCCNVVFVRDKDYFQPDAPKFFHVRKVRLGVEQNGVREIIVGLLPGEVVASKGSNVLESQLLKSNLGAGCGCTE